MRIKKRRVVYGSTIGVSTFVAGVILVWLTTPVNQVEGLTNWRAALWIFLDANGVVLEPGASNSVLLDETAPNLPTLRIGYVLPFLLVAFGTVLTASGVSGTGRLRYILENGSAILYGYLGVGLIALLESGARPAIAGFTALILFFMVAIYVGSTVVGRLTGGMPFIGVASLGLVAVIGMVFVFVGLAILDAMLPMIVVASSGMLTGGSLLWTVRQAPR
jgi:hypothetical protein